MQLVLLFIMIIFFMIIIWIMGKVTLKCIKDSAENAFFLGFFIYFSVFQLLALPLILALKPLSWLSYAWLIIIGLVCVGFVFGLKNKRQMFREGIRTIKIQNVFNISFLLMVILLLGQIYYALLHSQNGWDAAYYIPNIVKSIATDSMYIYQGSTGIRGTKINFRYAISTFYMHDAVLGQISGIHGAIVCRWFNTIVCHVFSALIVYKIGNLIFKKKKSAQCVVCFWILANFSVYTMYLANAFLMTRAYEAKAYCNNIIIPAIVYIFLKIYRKPEEKSNWIELFIINVSSVAISASSLLLIPVLNVCLFVGHLVISRRGRDVWKMLACLLPNLIYLFLFLLYKLDYFVITIPG